MKKKIFSLFVALFALAGMVGTSSTAVAAESCGNWADVWWKPQPGATKYHVYFTEEEAWTKWWKWNHSVRNVPVADQGMRKLTVHCLKPGVKYVARVSAVGKNGKEYWWSDAMHLMAQP